MEGNNDIAEDATARDNSKSPVVNDLPQENLSPGGEVDTQETEGATKENSPSQILPIEPAKAEVLPKHVIQSVSQQKPPHIANVANGDENVDTSLLRRSERKITHTTKGKQNILSNSISFMKSCRKRLQKQVDIVLLLLSSSNVDAVNNEMNTIERTYAEFTESYARACSVVAEEGEEDLTPQQNEVAALMDNTDNLYLGCKENVCCWLIQKDKEKANDGSDVASSAKSSKSGSKSRSGSSKSKSTHSSSSKKSSNSDHSLRQKAKLAGLKAEAEAMKKVKEAELSVELSRIAAKIKKAEAKEKVYSSNEGNKLNQKDDIVKANITHSFNDGRHDDAIGHKEHHRDCTFAVNPNSLDLATTSQMQIAMMDLMQQQSAPKPDLDSFSGDPLEYLYFKANFQDIVEKSIRDQRGRLTRLISKTEGEAKELIKHLVHADHTDCYTKAFALLDKEYGNHHLISCSYIKQLREWKHVKENDVDGFKKLFRFLLKCQTYKSQDRLQELDSTDMIKTVISKTHSSVQGRWARKALDVRHRKSKDPNFNDLVKFFEKESEVLCDPAYSRNALMEVNLLKSNSTICDTKVSFLHCPFCNELHDVEDCEEFLSKGIDDRHKFIFRHGLCFGCLKPIGSDHNGKSCTDKRKCRACNGDHPTTLHDGKGLSANHTKIENDISMCVVPVELWHKNDPDHKVKVYALLDECSTGTFIREDVLESLSLTDTIPSATSVTTLSGTDNSASTKVQGLVVRCLPSHAVSHSSTEINLPTTYSRPTLAVEEDEIPTPSRIDIWPYLHDLKKDILEYDSSIMIGLMIGGDCPKALEPMQVIHCVDEGPYAKRTRLGWCIVGPIKSTSTDRLQSNRIKSNHTRVTIPVEDVVTGSVASHCLTLKEPVHESFAAKSLRDMYNIEFNETEAEKRALSQDDEKFLEIMKHGAIRRGKKHELPLPFRNNDVVFPDNKQQVRGRLASLKRQLARDPSKYAAYKEKMDWLISKYSQVADTSADKPGRVWRIPHHGVWQKGKLRVVFDLSAQQDGIALNTELLQGPDMTNLMAGVMLRFRLEDIALMADIEAMFYQVLIPESQRSFMRFFWFKDGNLDGEVVEYEMCVHPFGAISSGACANYALRKTADEQEFRFGTDVADTVRKDFYVDDWLKSVRDVSSAISLVKNVRDLCDSGGFNLAKFISNCREVIESVPVENRAPSLVNLDLLSTLPMERALGMHWSVENDSLEFRVILKDLPLTRRSVLGTISSIYDLLGLVSSFVLPGRKVLQKIVNEGGCWDDSLPQILRVEWEKWRIELLALQNLKVKRCYKPEGFQVASSTLHCFSDASDYGYGQASYLQQVSKDGEVSVSLVMAKSRVVPLKTPTTVPRMETTAGFTSCKVGTLLKEELGIPDLSVKYWVDSTIVLGYIRNETKRFRTYVANRVKKIRSMTAKEDWGHVYTHLNPADDCSRGLSVFDEEKVDRWFYGPPQLRSCDSSSCGNDPLDEVPDDDPEVIAEKKCNVTLPTVDEHLIINTLGGKVSAWARMVRLVAALHFFVQVCTGARGKNSSKVVKDNVRAQNQLFRMVQLKHFPREVSDLSSGKSLLKSSSLRKLRPFLDSKGILRVGGRLSKTTINSAVKTPIILPKKEIVVTRIVQWCHYEVEHLGQTSTLGEIRSRGYWVISGTSQVRQVIRQCFRCRVLRGLPAQQQMGDLPENRSGNAPPFSYCGVDLFGPFTIKERRSELKRYGVVFTCFGCRAVHLETTITLDTDSFILALRRFVGRRGPVRSIRSDNGGNFVGADGEMKKAMREMDHERIQKYLSSVSCDWEWLDWDFNPASASHMGGVWERQIRTVRNVLSSLLMDHGARLNDEALRTLFVEVEAIVNSRPLSVDTLNDETMEPLSPNSLLTMKTKVVLPPPGVFQRDDVYCRRRWRAVQYLANEFWSRWRKEYLLNLQQRQKWNSVHPNLCVGDVVLLVDDDVKRNRWPMGRIVEVFPSEDGLVRSVSVRTAGTGSSTLSRPVTKVVLLLKCPPQE